MKQDLLIIAHRIPYPPNKGDKIRSYHIVQHLATRYRVTLACIIDDPEDVAHIATLRELVHEVHYCLRGPWSMRLHAASALLTGRACTQACFYCRSLQPLVDDFLSRTDVAAVLCFCSSTADYINRSTALGRRHPLLLNDLIDVDSLKWEQYAEKHKGFMRWLYRRESRLLRACERHIISRCDRIFLVSEEERQALATHAPVDKVVAMSNGVDTNYFDPSCTGTPLERQESRILFSGAMDYWPNGEGVVWFAQEIFPLVQKEVPEARFCIAGRNPTEAIQALAQRPGIEVTGAVPDMRTWLCSATVCVVPLRIARGIQNKVLEAMAMARPVVATSGAVTGTGARHGEQLLVADTPAAMAAAVISLLRDPERARILGEQARLYVEQAHSWPAHLNRLSDVLASSRQQLAGDIAVETSSPNAF